MALKVKVNVSKWSASDHDVELAGGTHVLEDPSDELVAAVAAAAAADPAVLQIVSGHSEHGVKDHVESDAESRKRLAEAMGKWDAEAERWSGPWHESNLEAQAVSFRAQASETEDEDMRARLIGHAEEAEEKLRALRGEEGDE